MLGNSHRARQLCPWLLSAGALSLYVATLCPTVHWSDSAEFAAAGAMLGLPHPPCSPTYVMLAWLISRLPFEPAYSINLLSALSAALAVGLCCRIQLRLGASVVAAALGAAVFATSPLLWAHATISEVYGLATVFELLTLLVLLRAVDERSQRACLLAGLLAGLGLGVHYGLATCGLGYALLVGATATGGRLPQRADLRRLLSLGAKTCGTVVLGASVLLYVPLRALTNPPVNPMSVSDIAGALWMLRGGLYGDWFHRELPWLRQLGWVLRVELLQLAYVGVAVALVGLGQLWVSGRRVHMLALLAIAVGNTWFFFDYAAFHLGAADYGEAGGLDPRYYREADVFFLPTVAALCCALGPGLDGLHAAIEKRGTSTAVSWALGGLLAAAVVVRGGVEFPRRDRSDDWSAFRFGQRAAAELPDNPVILNYTTAPEWKGGTVFHLYFMEVRGVRPDVTVLQRPAKEYVDWLLLQGFAVFVYAEVPAETDRWQLVPEAGLLRVTPRS